MKWGPTSANTNGAIAEGVVVFGFIPDDEQGTTLECSMPRANVPNGADGVCT